MRAKPAPAVGGCPAGYVALDGNQGWCYSKIGTPVTITSAAVSPVTAPQPNPPVPLSSRSQALQLQRILA
jgi:hypothetical protein